MSTLNICCTAEELKSSKTPCLRKTQRNIGTPVTPCRWSEIFWNCFWKYGVVTVCTLPVWQSTLKSWPMQTGIQSCRNKMADRHMLWACMLPNARANLLWQHKLLKVNRRRGCNDRNYESFNILLNCINCWCLINEVKWPQIITG